ncbi:MAG: hypothetical protein QF486_05455 [Candidatus Woesearchaeota archaeon]|nr:hypothetical protein [Candidatus Woesearchaeota archaeon]MDP7181859.1 hypothetical protein [Candidatus Woesearchaeota archaeon]MDP7199035.1 hypothetical protein [Candidatus Woesearchaeota archaeon]MDP7467711.1 hypothetical protein [Candidatus Woesearchaeota archaeon]MDP7646795.1 hypothetical protein [Candidatus Woesearchaeota archaeon]
MSELTMAYVRRITGTEHYTDDQNAEIASMRVLPPAPLDFQEQLALNDVVDKAKPVLGFLLEQRIAFPLHAVWQHYRAELHDNSIMDGDFRRALDSDTDVQKLGQTKPF